MLRTASGSALAVNRPTSNQSAACCIDPCLPLCKKWTAEDYPSGFANCIRTAHRRQALYVVDMITLSRSLGGCEKWQDKEARRSVWQRRALPDIL
jgi:hypothetical protein